MVEVVGVPSVYVTVTNAGYLPTLREDAAAGGLTNWTVGRHLKKGDRVLLYAKAPISAVVAEAFVASKPVVDDDVNSTWYGLFFADLYGLRVFREFLTRDRLMREMPGMGFWRQPRRGTLVAGADVSKLLSLLEGCR